MSDEIPKDTQRNTPAQAAVLERAVAGALLAAGSGVTAVAVIVVLEDGAVTAGLGGAREDAAGGFARIDLYGAEMLRLTLNRLKAGKGTTKIIPVQEPGKA